MFAVICTAHKVTMQYFRGANYLEIDAKVDDSMLAASILKLCRHFSKRIVVDMTWKLQSDEKQEELERMLCGVTIHYMDFAKCPEIGQAIEFCPRFEYHDSCAFAL